MSIDKNLGPATAYGYAKSKGYTGTEEEYAELMANMAEAIQILENKADKDGTYPDMTVGNVFSDDSYTEDQTPYLYRVSGGGVEVGKIEADKIVGGTVAFNQLVQNGNFADTSGWQAGGSSSVSVSNGEATVTIGSAWNNDIRQAQSTIGNHVYFATFSVKSDSATAFRVSFSQTGATGTNASFARSGLTTSQFSEVVGISKPSNDASIIRLVRVESGADAIGEKFTVKSIMLIDLTQMFGTSVADYIYSLEQSSTGAGVAFFRKLFPDDYYEFNAGELKSVEGLQSHDMVGFNQWDEEWEMGQINPSTGANAGNTTSIRAKNYIPIIPDVTYYCKASASVYLFFYDKNKQYIGYSGSTARDKTFKPSTLINNVTGKADMANAAYARFRYDVTSYSRDLCINLSDPSRNGEYEPYVKHSYPLDSSLTLRGIPKVTDGKLYYDGDIYSADGTVQRKYGIVDLGSLNWNNENSRFYTSDLASLINKEEGTLNLISTQFIATYRLDFVYANEKGYMFLSGAGNLSVTKNGYTTASGFKTAMNGVMLVYELATPTEETAQAYTEYQKVSKYGTEEYVSTSIVPVGHVTKYPVDIVAKVNGLPSDFSTLIAPTESAMKATKAYTANDLIIVNNQLYRATTSIASGATLTVGTNVVTCTIASLIKGLL